MSQCSKKNYYSLCVCLYFFVLTSGAVFLLCSPVPRFSMLRLASKHSGHTRLVLLSIFEHFAQMACRRTESEQQTVICLKFPLVPPLFSPSHQKQRPNLSRSICAHRSAGLAVMFALGEIEALAAAFTCLLLLLLFLGTLLEKKGLCVKAFSLLSFSTSEAKGMSDSLSCYIPCLFGFLSPFSPFY